MFTGFSEKTADFMWGIRLNNNKEWFEEHKEDYKQHLAQPMSALANEVYSRFTEQTGASELTLHVSRIYRDARRLFGRGPYKDHLWFTIRKPTEWWVDMPAFWFELAPEGLSYGMGYYHARPLTMEKHRARIDNDPKRLLALSKALDERGEFVLEGEEYKRAKVTKTSELAAWYNKKWFSLIHEAPLSKDIEAPALVERLAGGFVFLKPFYDYFASLEADKNPKE